MTKKTNTSFKPQGLTEQQEGVLSKLLDNAEHASDKFYEE